MSQKPDNTNWISKQQQNQLDLTKLGPYQTSEFEKLLKADLPGYKKQAYLSWILSKPDYEPQKKTAGKDSFKGVLKSKEYKSLLQKQKEEAKSQYVICSIMIMISATLVFFFAAAVLRQIYFISFSVDAIVGVAALFILIRNMQVKYQLVSLYTDIRYYVTMDLTSMVLCLLLKIILPPNVDVSLVVLMFSYYMQKQRFDRQLGSLD